MNELFIAQIRPRSWLVRATVLAGSLGLIHILATPLYVEQWLGYSMVFVGVAVLQVFHSMVLAVNPPSRAFLWLGVAGNALIVAAWAFTRTVGIPIGPMAGEILPLGFLDGFAQVLEVVQILHLAVLLHQFDRLAGRPLVE